MASVVPPATPSNPPPLIVASNEPTVIPGDVPPPTSVQPAPRILKVSDSAGKNPPRIFIGPMPKKEVPPPLPEPPDKYRALRRKLSSIAHSSQTKSTRQSTADIGVDEVDDRHAFLYFLRHGGKEEDWTEEAELSVRHEILRKWKESGWATVRSKKKQGRQATGSNWVGTTFEVGHISGVSLGDVRTTESPEAVSEASSIRSGLTPTALHAPSKSPLVESPLSVGNGVSSIPFIRTEEHVDPQPETDASDYELEQSVSIDTASSLDPSSPFGNRSSMASNAPLLNIPASDHYRQRVLSAPNLLGPSNGKANGDASGSSVGSSQYVMARSEADLSLGNTPSPVGQGIKSAFRKVSNAQDASLSSPSPNDKRKGKQKAVTFPADHQLETYEEDGDEPHSAQEVLTRQGNQLAYSSAGATKAIVKDVRPSDTQDVYMRGKIPVWYVEAR
jgi:hypothetical protein